ncbi:MAG: tripartite tricarboxylate transporter substrate binding protein [Betaproteobacteria bacterium]|nr:tripartite tricarboxylate transporter substrate binding protein [Betaproteobacteria bacterium]
MNSPFALMLLVLAMVCAGTPHAQTYPDRPVRLIMPFPASGPADIMARLYGQKLSERWGKPVVVENRAGATGTIGTDAVAKAPADGLTLLFTVDLPIVMAPALFKTPYDAKKDLLPIAIMGESMNMLLVHPSTGVNTLAEFVGLAKAKPGTLTFSSAGNASPGHMCGEMLKAAAGISLIHVPYKGAAPSMTAVLAGEVSMFCGPIPQGLPHLKSGKLKALGVTGSVPSALVPDARPLSETYQGLVLTNWYGVFAPRQTPASIAQILRADIKRVADDPEIRQKLSSVGIDPLWVEGRDVDAAIERDLAKWTRVVRDSNIKVE